MPKSDIKLEKGFPCSTSEKGEGSIVVSLTNSIFQLLVPALVPIYFGQVPIDDFHLCLEHLLRVQTVVSDQVNDWLRVLVYLPLVLKLPLHVDSFL